MELLQGLLADEVLVVEPFAQQFLELRDRGGCLLEQQEAQLDGTAHLGLVAAEDGIGQAEEHNREASLLDYRFQEALKLLELLPAPFFRSAQVRTAPA